MAEMARRRKLEASGVYLLGKKDGRWQYYSENGSLREASYWQADTLNGLTVNYFDSGGLESAFVYKNNRTHGAFVYFYEDGSVYMLGYNEMGKGAGTSFTFEPDGRIRLEKTRK